MDTVEYDIREITARIKRWCDEVYPTRTRDQMISKLQEEFSEFAAAPLDAFEMADIAIILFDLSDHLGFDLAKVINHKMDINKRRVWRVNENGILKHRRKEITRAEFSALMTYNPDTGVFTGTDGRTKGCVHPDGGIVIQINGLQYQAHRLAVLAMTGRMPEQYTDHINGIRTDNRWENLREVSPAENCRNMKMPNTNTSGHIGVTKHKNRWKAHIKIRGKTIHLGYHSTFEAACRARQHAEKEHGFHANHGRVQNVKNS